MEKDPVYGMNVNIIKRKQIFTLEHDTRRS